MVTDKKSLGQYWLTDVSALEAITEAAQIKPSDTVLEIGPGLGTLTAYLLREAGHLIAVEIDENLAVNLEKNLSHHISSHSKDGPWNERLKVISADILHFDLTQLPAGYKVVANIPYYLTSNLLRLLAESINPPIAMVLLVQKEVAERICAGPGQTSLLSISVQLYYLTQLGLVVPAELFEPSPKVDSQLVILKHHPKPLFHDLDTKVFFRIVKAGFSGRRKKLRGSLSAGLQISKQQADALLEKAAVSGDLRAQNLSLQDWYSVYRAFTGKNASAKITS